MCRHRLAGHDDGGGDSEQRRIVFDVGGCDVWARNHVGVLGEK